MRHLPAALFLASLLLCALPGRAAADTLLSQPAGLVSWQASPDAVESTNCSLGIVSTIGNGSPSFKTISFFVHVDPAQCSVCPAPRAVSVKSVRITLCGVGDMVKMTVTLVDQAGAADTPIPVPASPLSPPQVVTFNIGCAGGNVGLTTVNLPTAMPLDRPCFVRVQMDVLNQDDNYPLLLIGVADCHPFQTFVSNPNGFTPVDACNIYAGDPRLWIGAACDAVVPTRTRAWGQLKMLYR